MWGWEFDWSSGGNRNLTCSGALHAFPEMTAAAGGWSPQLPSGRELCRQRSLDHRRLAKNQGAAGTGQHPLA